MKKEHYIFDVVKFILCLFIVQIHIGLFFSFSISLDELFKNLIGRYATPLFFMISSYLLFNKVDKSNLFLPDNILIYKRYFKRLSILYFSWFLVYFICFYFIFDMHINLVGLLVNFLFGGFYRQFWFIIAQIFGMALFLVLLRFFSIKKVMFIGFLFYVMGLVLVPYNSLAVNLFEFIPKYDGDIFMARNFCNFALIYISLGGYFSFNKEKKIKVGFLSILLFFSFIFSIIEFIFLKHIGCEYYALQFFLILVCVFIFLLCLNIKLKYRPIYIKLRKYSILIFCLHTLVYVFLHRFLGNYSFLSNSVVMYFSVVAVCIFLSDIILLINRCYLKLNFLY